MTRTISVMDFARLHDIGHWHVRPAVDRLFPDCPRVGLTRVLTPEQVERLRRHLQEIGKLPAEPCGA